MLVCSGHLSNSPAHGCGTVETPPVLSQVSVSDGPLKGDVPVGKSVGKCLQPMWSFSSSLGKGTMYFLRKLFSQWPEFPGLLSKATVKRKIHGPWRLCQGEQ